MLDSILFPPDGIKILVVDDSRVEIQLMEAFLHTEGIPGRLPTSGGETIEKVATEKPSVVPMDVVLISIGFIPKLESVERWGLELKGKAVVVNPEMRTNLRGVFACGDLVTYEGKAKRITTACGEATTAVNSAYKYIRKPYWA